MYVLVVLCRLREGTFDRFQSAKYSYDVHDKEVLTVVHALKEEKYLHGAQSWG
jgi:hypothetical protein